MPQSVWAANFMNKPETKDKLGVPQELNFTFGSTEIYREFAKEGDE